MTALHQLKNVLLSVKQKFVDKDEIIDLLGICLLARENAFLLGPPGTAKSAIVTQLAKQIEGGNNFEYLLTRFTEPNEIFGPFDIRKLKEGELVTNTEGMLPEASLVFLDEIFNANSAILNSLLMALNEKVFRRGKETRKLPALMFVGASNLLPDDEALSALLDRFLIRVKCDYVNPEHLNEVLLAGWQLQHHTTHETTPSISAQEIKSLQSLCQTIDLSAVRKPFVDLVLSLRNAGIKVSDRRAVKIQNLIAASALICERKEALLSDLWVAKYIWDTEEQIEILAGMVDTIIGKENHEQAHTLAFPKNTPNAEALIKEVELIKNKWELAQGNFEEQNILKDKLRYIQNRVNWIKDAQHKQHIQNEIENLWKLMLQTI